MSYPSSFIFHTKAYIYAFTYPSLQHVILRPHATEAESQREEYSHAYIYIYIYSEYITWALARGGLTSETYIKVRLSKHLFDNFPIQNGLKQGDALAPLRFNFALEYANRKVLDTQVGLKLNGTHQLLVYADDVNLLGDDIGTIKKHTNFN
jgi:hypothetical protein